MKLNFNKVERQVVHSNHLDTVVVFDVISLPLAENNEPVKLLRAREIKNPWPLGKKRELTDVLSSHYYIAPKLEEAATVAELRYPGCCDALGVRQLPYSRTLALELAEQGVGLALVSEDLNKPNHVNKVGDIHATFTPGLSPWGGPTSEPRKGILRDEDYFSWATVGKALNYLEDKMRGLNCKTLSWAQLKVGINEVKNPKVPWSLLSDNLQEKSISLMALDMDFGPNAARLKETASKPVKTKLINGTAELDI